MQETLTFPTMGSPGHRFTFSQSYDTDFSERCSQVSTPFVSAPSSPGRHCDGGFYFSAPASPHWAYTFTDNIARDYPSSIPLHWDEKPGTPRRRSNGKDEAGSFLTTSDFEFSARFPELDDPSMSPTPMSSANELFCNGQIRPLRIHTRIEYPSCSTSRINMEERETTRISMDERATCRINNECAITTLSNAFEFHSRGAYPEAPNSSTSAPHSPRFSSTFGCVAASACGIYEVNKGRSASSLSAPQSPHSPINRVKGALCGVSPSRIDRAFDTSIHMPIEVSREALQSSNRINKPFDTSMHMSLEGSMESSIHAREGSRRAERSMLSRAIGSQVAGHRRTRSFSPLRIFHRGDHPSSSLSMRGIQQEVTTHTLSRDLSANEKKHEDDFHAAPKSLNKKWTLKDLLHRKSGGENRWNSSRASSRRSGASADSTSSIERMGGKSLSAGRSSSESSHSSISSCNTYTKDVSTSKLGSRGLRMQGGESINNQNNANSIGKKGIKQGMCEGKANNNNKGSMCKALKGSSQRGMKGNNEKGCISPHEMHYMMHKAQSEELRKRTFLPYRQGLLGCLGFTSRSYRTVSSISKTLQSVSG